MSDSESKLVNFLHQFLKEKGSTDYDLEIKPINSEGANYTSKIYEVAITEGGNTTHLFAKVAAFSEVIRSYVAFYYDIEIIAYTKLTKLYEQIQEEHKVPLKHRGLFPKFYAWNMKKYEETIVLENLALEGYQAYNRSKTIEWTYAKAAINALADMHALGFALSEYMPEEFNQIVENIKYSADSMDENMRTFWNAVVDQGIRNTCEEHRSKVQEFFDRHPAMRIGVKYYSRKARRPVLIHNDFRPSNLMHKVLDDGTIDIKILDLQTIQGSSPVIDLLYFIFTGSDEEFRAQYYDKLIDHYYTELTAAMKRLHLDPEKVYSREDFDFELKEKLPFGLTIAVFALPIITVDAEDAPEVNENMDLSTFSVEKTNDLYTQRLNGVVNDYVKWGILK